ncbi:MAG: helix-turn-helix transcriptional regulator [Ruminococcus sp.]|nr:helix-turn-helix transcriptional regulator [Ruminococcus sp.]
MAKAIETQIYPYAEKTQGLPVCLRGIGGTEYQGYVRRGNEACWHQVLYCLSGTGCLNLPDMSFEIGAGDVIFLPKAFPNEYFPHNKRWEMRWVVFDGSRVEELLSELGIMKPFVLKHIDLKEINKLFDKMLSALRVDRVNGIYKCSGLCYQLLLELCCLLRNEKLPADDIKNEILTPVLTHIEESFRRDLPVNELVSISGVSHQYLGRIFHQAMGTSIEKYIRRRRLWEAKTLLLESDLPIKDIACRCGFADAGYFSTVFRREEGLTPASYRRKIRQDQK